MVISSSSYSRNMKFLMQHDFLKGQRAAFKQSCHAHVAVLSIYLKEVTNSYSMAPSRKGGLNPSSDEALHRKLPMPAHPTCTALQLSDVLQEKDLQLEKISYSNICLSRPVLKCYMAD